MKTKSLTTVESELKELRQRVAEFHHEIALNNIHIEELKIAYKQRGERMKEMRDALDARNTYWVAYQKWFKDGEPL